ncbi:MAG TPA: biopolymer transporter ExbD [Myxococcota bacterium]|nr:biopolymer transporter ExbD [Myxococcota bacterium]
MPVRTPGRRAGSGIALRQIKRTIEGKTNRNLSASVNLTSLIDFMSVLVIFLLMNFSADGDLAANAPDVVPPAASSGSEIKRLPIIAISEVNVTFEGVIVESSRVILSENDDYTLPRLTEALKREEEAFKILRPNQEFKGEVIIQAHEKLPYKLVRRVFVAAAKAGFSNINYMTRKVGAEP